MYLSYASAHAHDSSNHSYVSMNMDSVNDRDQAVLSSAPRYPISIVAFLTMVFMSQQLLCWSYLSLQVPTWLRVVLGHKMIQTAL